MTSHLQPQRLPGQLYDYPEWCDALFRDRTSGEVRFIRSCVRPAVGARPTRLLEAASGSGRLLLALVRAGLDVAGFDHNRRSVDYCNARLARHGYPAAARPGRLEHFRATRRVDALLCMLNGFRHLDSEHSVRAHFAAAARALKRGGLYILGLELTPPGARYVTPWRTITRRGRVTLVTDLVSRSIDEAARCETRQIIVDLHTPRRWRRLTDTLCLRTYTSNQLEEMIASLDEFELTGAYDLRRLTARPGPLRHDSEDACFVLRRT